MSGRHRSIKWLTLLKKTSRASVARQRCSADASRQEGPRSRRSRSSAAAARGQASPGEMFHGVLAADSGCLSHHSFTARTRAASAWAFHRGQSTQALKSSKAPITRLSGRGASLSDDSLDSCCTRISSLDSCAPVDSRAPSSTASSSRSFGRGPASSLGTKKPKARPSLMSPSEKSHAPASPSTCTQSCPFATPMTVPRPRGVTIRDQERQASPSLCHITDLSASGEVSNSNSNPSRVG
mmetsp:Transcript_30833/g.69224  ORF Transcript_30833/g.69224 Transcript_30833/m.69224 type:complete len:239 (+) Transcript_30833:1827-2543(+)